MVLGVDLWDESQSAGRVGGHGHQKRLESMVGSQDMPLEVREGGLEPSAFAALPTAWPCSLPTQAVVIGSHDVEDISLLVEARCKFLGDICRVMAHVNPHAAHRGDRLWAPDPCSFSEQVREVR